MQIKPVSQITFYTWPRCKSEGYGRWKWTSGVGKRNTPFQRKIIQGHNLVHQDEKDN